MDKKILYFVALLSISFSFAQKKILEKNSTKKTNSIINIEVGCNVSIPVHIMMFRTHGLAIGGNLRAWKTISPQLNLGIKLDYDYRFRKKTDEILTSENTIIERASHSNYSIIAIKPNLQYNTKFHWFLGAEIGVGFAISDEDSKIGLGFVSEYGGPQQFGLNSGIYLGRYFRINKDTNKLGVSLDLNQFMAHGHAENNLGIKLKYKI